MLLSDVRLSDIRLSRTSGVTRIQRGLGRLKLAQGSPHLQHSDLGKNNSIRLTLMNQFFDPTI